MVINASNTTEKIARCHIRTTMFSTKPYLATGLIRVGGSLFGKGNNAKLINWILCEGTTFQNKKYPISRIQLLVC